MLRFVLIQNNVGIAIASYLWTDLPLTPLYTMIARRLNTAVTQYTGVCNARSFKCKRSRATTLREGYVNSGVTALRETCSNSAVPCELFQVVLPGIYSFVHCYCYIEK